MTQINRIVFFGCSITYGTGLEEDIREKFSWPGQLCGLLGCESLNMGLSGSSNYDSYSHLKYYLNSTSGDQQYFPGDFVIISLTGPQRHSSRYHDSSKDLLRSSKTSIIKICNLLTYKDIPFTIVEAFINYYRYFDFDDSVTKHFMNWCKEETSLYDIISDTYGLFVDPDNVKELDRDHYHDTSNRDLYLPCTHPTVLGHRKIANKLAPIISERLTAISDK